MKHKWEYENFGAYLLSGTFNKHEIILAEENLCLNQGLYFSL